MQKDLRKILVGLFCVSLMGFQSTFADVTNLDVLNNVNGGAHIDTSNGLSKVDTNGTKADLHFGSGDAIINWSHLNVGKGQQLNFLNNNGQAVLNNVKTGMSEFAGAVRTGSGMVIISNPNGIVMTGANFNAGGALILTTQNLTGVGLSESGKLSFTESLNKMNASTVVLYGTAASQTAVKGDALKDASYSSFDNFTYTTTDGANYVVCENLNGNIRPDYAVTKFDGGTISGGKYNAENDSVVKDSSIKGNIAINSATDTMVRFNWIKNPKAGVQPTSFNSKMEITGDVSVYAPKAVLHFYNTDVANLDLDALRLIVNSANVTGDMKLTSAGYTSAYTSSANTLDINSSAETYLDSVKIAGAADIKSVDIIEIYNTMKNDTYNSDFGSLSAVSQSGSIIYNGGTVNGNATLVANASGNSTGTPIIKVGIDDSNAQSATTIKGVLTTSSTGGTYIHSTGNLQLKDAVVTGEGKNLTIVSDSHVKVENANIANDMSIDAPLSAQVVGGEIGNDLIIDNAAIIRINYVKNPASGVQPTEFEAKTVIGGDLIINSPKATAHIYNTDVDNVVADGNKFIFNTVNATGKMDIDSNDFTTIYSSTSDSLDIDSGNFVYIDGMNVAKDVDIDAKTYVEIYNSNFGTLDVLAGVGDTFDPTKDPNEYLVQVEDTNIKGYTDEDGNEVQGDLNLESKYGTVIYNGGTTEGDATLKANTTKTEGATGMVIVGNDGTNNPKDTTIKGTLTTESTDGTYINVVGDLTIGDNSSSDKDFFASTNGDVNVNIDILSENVKGTITINAGGNASGSGSGNVNQNLSTDELLSESAKVYNNLRAEGIPVGRGENFTPIAFASSEKKNDKKRVANASSTVYKTDDEVIHVSGRTNAE